MNPLTEPCGGFVIHESTQHLLLTTVANMIRSLPLSIDLHFFVIPSKLFTFNCSFQAIFSVSKAF